MIYPIDRTKNLEAAHQFCLIRDCLHASGYGLKFYRNWTYKIYPRSMEYTAPLLFIAYNELGQGNASQWWDLQSRSDIPDKVMQCVQGAGLASKKSEEIHENINNVLL